MTGPAMLLSELVLVKPANRSILTLGALNWLVARSLCRQPGTSGKVNNNGAPMARCQTANPKMAIRPDTAVRLKKEPIGGAPRDGDPQAAVGGEDGLFIRIQIIVLIWISEGDPSP